MPNNSPLQHVTLEHLLFLHTVAIAEFGGESGIRDSALLEAALGRPWTGLEGALFYDTPFSRAAALLESLIRNHGFVDGNKRVAVMAAAFWLEGEGLFLNASNEEVIEMAYAAASEEMTVEQLGNWFRSDTSPDKSRCRTVDTIGPEKSMCKRRKTEQTWMLQAM